MSGAIEDGGYAFPLACEPGNDNGITKLDYFAAVALAGSLARANSTPGTHPKSPDGYAMFAYEVANAMLRQRRRQ